MHAEPSPQRSSFRSQLAIALALYGRLALWGAVCGLVTFAIISLWPHSGGLVYVGIVMGAIATSLTMVLAKKASPRSVRKRVVVTVFLVLVIAIFLPPNINQARFRDRLSASLSGTIGQRVTIGQVQYRLFPRAGFDLYDFKVMNDRTDGAVPIVSSGKVSSDLRLASLWKGTLEIASLKFVGNEAGVPTLNLTRTNGQWSVQDTLRHLVETGSAPNSEGRTGRIVRFPYIEAIGARVNWTTTEGNRFGLINSNIGLWQNGEDSWHMRADGKLIRTSMHTDNLGDVRIDGVTWRSLKAQGMPLNVSVSWNSVPIAEFIQLTTGAKVEWRGQLNALARFEGSPHDLHITATGNVSDFKAALNSDARQVQVACKGQVVDRAVDISCSVPSEPAGLVINVTGALDQPKITTTHSVPEQSQGTQKNSEKRK